MILLIDNVKVFMLIVHNHSSPCPFLFIYLL